jgi:hypothetical protein
MVCLSCMLVLLSMKSGQRLHFSGVQLLIKITQAHMRPQAGAGKFQARAWPEEDTLAPATPQKADTGRRRARWPAQLAPGGRQASSADCAYEAARPPSWRAQVQELERTVNAELRTALSSAMLLLADQVSGWHIRSGRPFGVHEHVG